MNNTEYRHLNRPILLSYISLYKVTSGDSSKTKINIRSSPDLKQYRANQLYQARIAIQTPWQNSLLKVRFIQSALKYLWRHTYVGILYISVIEI
jgi:hypothetical protein